MQDGAALPSDDTASFVPADFLETARSKHMRKSTLLVATLGLSLMGLSTPAAADGLENWQLSHGGFVHSL